MLVLVGHSLYKLLNKVLYERFMQVHVGPYWTSVDVETETAFSLRPIGPYWTTLGKRSTVGSYILRGAHNTILLTALTDGILDMVGTEKILVMFFRR